MKTYKIGDKIALTLVSQTGKRITATGDVMSFDAAIGPRVKITHPELNKTIEVDLVQQLMQDTRQGLSYRGEIGGATLVPNMFWVSP